LLLQDSSLYSAMKFTQYFLHVKQRIDRAVIKMEWIEQTIENPIHTEVQLDGRIRKWKKIEEEGKFLRVILLPDGETVHNAFFDRGFNEVKKK
jgi:hypothetical protein